MGPGVKTLGNVVHVPEVLSQLEAQGNKLKFFPGSIRVPRLEDGNGIN